MKKEKSEYKYLTEKEKKEIAYLYWYSKKNLKTIAKSFDISPQTVTEVAQKFVNPMLKKNNQSVILVTHEHLETALLILREYGIEFAFPSKFELTYQIESKINAKT